MKSWFESKDYNKTKHAKSDSEKIELLIEFVTNQNRINEDLLELIVSLEKRIKLLEKQSERDNKRNLR